MSSSNSLLPPKEKRFPFTPLCQLQYSNMISLLLTVCQPIHLSNLAKTTEKKKKKCSPEQLDQLRAGWAPKSPSQHTLRNLWVAGAKPLRVLSILWSCHPPNFKLYPGQRLAHTHTWILQLICKTSSRPHSNEFCPSWFWINQTL